MNNVFDYLESIGSDPEKVLAETILEVSKSRPIEVIVADDVGKVLELLDQNEN